MIRFLQNLIDAISLGQHLRAGWRSASACCSASCASPTSPMATSSPFGAYALIVPSAEVTASKLVGGWPWYRSCCRSIAASSWSCWPC